VTSDGVPTAAYAAPIAAKPRVLQLSKSMYVLIVETDIYHPSQGLICPY
jgi:hypothetical protein